MIGGDIKVVMTLDDNGVETKLVRMGEVIQRTTQQLDTMGDKTKKTESAFKSMATGFKDLVFAISILRFALNDINDIFLSMPRSLMETAGEFQRMQKLMEGMSKETDVTRRKLEAIANQRYVIQLSLNAPFSVGAIQDAFVKFKTGGIDPTNGSLKALIDSVAKFGGSEEQLKRAAVAIQQMAGKGVVSMEELRQQLGEAVPNAIELMAEGTGMSMASLVKKISLGQVEASSALDRMFTVMSIRNRGAAAEMMTTWTGALQQLKTNIDLFKNTTATIGEEGGGTSFAKEMQASLIELNRLFASPEVKQFAYNLGTGLAEGVRFLREGVPVLAQWGEYLKVAGLALVGYLGAQKFQAIISGVKQVRAEAEKLAESSKPSGQGGFLSNYFEQYRRLELEQERQNARNQMDAQRKIAFNQRMIAENERAAANALSVERRAHLERVRMATEELRMAQAKAAAKQAEAAALTQQAGKNYAEAVRYERMIQAIDESGKKRQGAKRANFVEQMELYRSLTTSAQQNAVAMRQEAAASVLAAEGKLAALRASKDYVVTARDQATALRGLNDNLRNAVDTLQTHAGAVTRLSGAYLSFRGIMAGFKSVFDAFGGWTTIVITGLGLATERLMSFMNRWKRAEEFRQAVANGVATREGIDEYKSRVGEMEGDAQAARNRVKTIADSVNTLRTQLEERNARNWTEAQRKSAAERLRVQEENLKRAQTSLAEAERKLAAGRQTVDNAERVLLNSKVDTESRIYIQTAENRLSNQLKALRDVQNKADKDLEDARTAALEKNKNLDAAKLDKLLKPQMDARINALKAQSQAALDFWRQQETEYVNKVVKATGDKKLELEAALAAIRGKVEASKREVEGAGRLGSTTLVGGNKDADKGALAVRLAEEKESPLFKALQQKRADVTKAKVEFAAINKDIDDLVGNAENQALIELLGRLAAGDFDRATKGKMPGVQPGAGQREKWMDDFRQFLEEGKGGAQEFLSTLSGLDVKLRASEESVRKMLAAFVKEAGGVEFAKTKVEALKAVSQRQAEVTEELAAAQRGYDNQISATPARILELEKSFAKLGERLRMNVAAFREFNDAKNKVMADAFRANSLNNATEIRRNSERANLEGITNRRERLAAENQLAINEIERKYAAERAAVVKSLGLTAQAAEEVKRINANRDEALLVQSKQFAQASKTELQKLADSWGDVSQQMERATASWAEKSADMIGRMLSGQKANFRDFALTVLKDLQMIMIRSQLAQGMQALGVDRIEGVGQSIMGALGFGQGGNAAAGMPIDRGANAMRVIIAGNNDPAAALGDEARKLVGDASDELKVKGSGMFEAVKTTAQDIFKGIEKTGSDMLDNWSSSFDMLINATLSMMNGSGGGGGGIGGLIQLGMSLYSASSGTPSGTEFNPDHFDFAKGGVMTKYGPLPLRAYAKGGIARANDPQLAVFGEGSMNEAYVPLPDGRSIPVTINSQQTGGGSNVVSIQINVDKSGGSNTEAEGDDPRQWKEMAERVRAVVLSELATQKRSGGMLRDN